MASRVSGKQLRIVLFKCADGSRKKRLQPDNGKDDNNNMCMVYDDIALSDRDERAAKRQKINQESFENESKVRSSSGQHVTASIAPKPKNRNKDTPIQSNIDTNTNYALSSRDLRALNRLNIKTESDESELELNKNGNTANRQQHDLFSVGSLVFAKLKSFRAWPAQITSESKRSYGVRFYGTNDTVIVSMKRLYKYTEYTINKFSFKPTKSKISKLFQLALNEIKSVSI